MLTIKDVVLPDGYQWQAVIMGARNPMNSWDKSDSKVVSEKLVQKELIPGVTETVWQICRRPQLILGQNDLALLKRLARAGKDHRKYMRMLPVTLTITAPLYWWKEFDTYKIGTTANSCSTMHKIGEKEFTIDDFSCEHLLDYGDDLEACAYSQTCEELISPKKGLEVIMGLLNDCRELFLKTKDKKYWWQMIQLLPSSYNQTRTVMLNYEVLINIYWARKDHKLDEWHTFCDWIRELPCAELITDEAEKMDKK